MCAIRMWACTKMKTMKNRFQRRCYQRFLKAPLGASVYAHEKVKDAWLTSPLLASVSAPAWRRSFTMLA